MAIRKKYAGRNDQATQQKMQQETMEMYQRENFNPASGCGTLLIQFPIIICLYNVITRPLRYISNVPAAEITALQNHLTESGVTLDVRNLQIDIINHIRGNVSDYFSIAPSLEDAVIPNFTVFGLDLSQTPKPSFEPFNWLVLIPIITFVVMILSQKIMQKYTYQSPETAAQQKSGSMKVMMWTMPLMSVIIEFNLAAAIGVYWIFRNVLQTIQRIIISKLMPIPKFTEEDYKEAERQANMSGKQRKKENKENKKFVRSLHYIDDEDYIERHKDDLAALDGGNTSSADEGNKKEVKNVKAPIKDDEKGSYKNK